MAKSYAEKLQHPKWQEKRLLILKRDKFKCKLCSDKETMLQVHHLKYTGNPWEANNEDLITYCKHCHTVVEYFKKWGIEIVKTFKAQDPFIIYCKADDDCYYRTVLDKNENSVLNSMLIYPHHFNLIVKKLK